MELFHYHLNGVKDRLYKPGVDFNVDPKTFNNRLSDMVDRMNPTVPNDMFPEISRLINDFFYVNYNCISPDGMNLGEIIGVALQLNLKGSDYKRLLECARDILQPMGVTVREIAMEKYRITNCPEKPSRLHSLFACDESALNYWNDRLQDGNYDLLRIQVADDTFVSNEQLFPAEKLCLGDKVINAHKYFHPKAKDLDLSTSEYLVQGKVRILEKVDEIRRG